MLGFGLKTTALAVGNPPSQLSLSRLSPSAWYDPSELGSLYQDTAMTIPVTADGDPVGAVQDRSGNGRHLVQSTSAKRPIYRQSGGLRWLEFDGVDDLLTAVSDVPFAAEMSVAGAFDVASIDSNYVEIIARHGTAVSTANRQPYISLSSANPGRLECSWGTSRARIEFVDLRTEGPVSFITTCSAGAVYGEANGLSASGDGVVLADSGSSWMPVGGKFTGKIFGLALFSSSLTRAQIVSAKSYFDRKAGL